MRSECEDDNSSVGNGSRREFDLVVHRTWLEKMVTRFFVKLNRLKRVLSEVPTVNSFRAPGP